MNCMWIPRSCCRRNWITACTSSLSLPKPRTWLSWIWAWTLCFVPLISFTISRAFSIGMPCWISIRCRTCPPLADSTVPRVSALRGTWRLTSFPSRMSSTCLSLNSSSPVTTMALSSRVTPARLPLKSKRWLISRVVWWTALSTSCRSTLEAMSKEHSLATGFPLSDPGSPSRPGGGDHRDPRRGRELELVVAQPRVQLQVGEGKHVRVPGRVEHRGLLDRVCLEVHFQENPGNTDFVPEGLEVQDRSV